MATRKYSKNDAEKCLNWCLMAYAATAAKGYFIANHFDIGSTDQLNVAAKRAGLVRRGSNNKKAGSVWVNMDRLPNQEDAELLLMAYTEYQRESSERFRAQQKKREARKATRAKALADHANRVNGSGNPDPNVTVLIEKIDGIQKSIEKLADKLRINL